MNKNKDDINKSSLIIKTQLKANIARNIIGNDGFYPIIKKIDLPLNKGIELLSN